MVEVKVEEDNGEGKHAELKKTKLLILLFSSSAFF